jgi:hypothetical protein
MKGFKMVRQIAHKRFGGKQITATATTVAQRSATLSGGQDGKAQRSTVLGFGVPRLVVSHETDGAPQTTASGPRIEKSFLARGQS